MNDVQLWQLLVGAPLYLMALVLLVRTFRDWPGIMERWNERQRDKVSEKAQDWARLREEVGRLAVRVETLERKVEECERDRDHHRDQAAEERAGRLAAEAQLIGRGRANQEAQRHLSEERLADKRKK